MIEAQRIERGWIIAVSVCSGLIVECVQRIRYNISCQPKIKVAEHATVFPDSVSIPVGRNVCTEIDTYIATTERKVIRSFRVLQHGGATFAYT